jgi:hypothetical protein
MLAAKPDQQQGHISNPIFPAYTRKTLSVCAATPSKISFCFLSSHKSIEWKALEGISADKKHQQKPQNISR